MSKQSSRKMRIEILTCVLLTFLVGTGLGIIRPDFNETIVKAQGYSTAFQGPKATFYGVNWAGRYYAYNTLDSTIGPPSMHEFDAIFRFDADADGSGYPKIYGEETSVFIPKESVGLIPSWLPSDWLNSESYISNPVKTYGWNVSENGVSKTYYMEQWLLRYYITFSAEWDGHEGDFPNIPFQYTFDNSYTNLQAWVKFDLTPTWYIQGQGTAYFAIGKVQLAFDNQYSGGADARSTGRIEADKGSITPESQTSLLYMSYAPFGQQASPVEATYFEGHALNPAYFRNQLYMRIIFNKFGIYGGVNFGNPITPTWTKGDTVTMAFDVTVFVIGKWDVQDIQNNPSDYGRFDRTSGVGQDLITLLTNFLFSPLGSLFTTIAIVLFLLIFFPWVIVAIIGAFGGRKR